MVKRILDATATDFHGMDAADLVESIQKSGGRTVSAEVICTYQSPVEGVTHAEIMAAAGADIIVLDHYDPDNPRISGAPSSVAGSDEMLAKMKTLLGLPVGINMAVFEEEESGTFESRRYTRERALRAVDQGCDILFLYGFPDHGGGTERVVAAIEETKSAREKVMVVAVASVSLPAPRTEQTVEYYNDAHQRFLAAGAEGIGLVMPGSKQGWTVEATARLVDYVHDLEGLVWLILTASVEGAPTDVIRQIALDAKMVGGDVYRIDEAGLSGMPPLENVLAFSLTVRGKRHTYRRMALSPLR